jgi:hypothetical protein
MVMKARINFYSNSRKKISVFFLTEDWPESLRTEEYFGVVIGGLGKHRFQIKRTELPTSPTGTAKIFVLVDAHFLVQMTDVAKQTEPRIVQDYELTDAVLVES